MSNDILITLTSIAAVTLFVLGVPILAIIGLWCIGISLIIDLSLANIGITLYEGLNAFALLAMPLFILTGDLINAAGIARKLTDFAYACLGWIRGGFGIAALGACGAFAAISGSNAATAATIGSIMHPQMAKDGYNECFSAATIASGGTVGIIIPPSIVFIIYGFLVNVSINDLFTAGLVPGIMMVFSMAFVCFLYAWKKKWGTVIRFSPVNVVKTGCKAYLGFAAMIIIIYGISSGSFSPTESAGICAGFCTVAGLLITRELKLSHLPSIMFNSGKMVGMVAPLVAVSIVMQQCLSAVGVDRFMASLLGGMDYYGVLLASMVMIFIAGMILESAPITTILAPVLGPIAASAGIDPVHFAMIFVVGAAIGFITPPFGLNLFVVARVTKMPFTAIVPFVLPYLAGLMITWLIIAFVPAVSTFML